MNPQSTTSQLTTPAHTIKCPVCDQGLQLSPLKAWCPNGHHFDRAKQGYLNLYQRHKSNTGDNQEMTQARHDFLNQGHYQFLAEALNKKISSLPGKSMLDCACGEGYYTRQFPKEVIGVDLSKPSLKIASRLDKTNTYLLASISNLPVFDQSQSIITKLFAPTYEEELQRVLHPEGTLIIVDVGPNHLYELKQIIYDKPYLNQIKQLNNFKLTDSQTLTKQVILNQTELQSLFNMTPYRYKTSYEDRERIKKVTELAVTFEFYIQTYQHPQD